MNLVEILNNFHSFYQVDLYNRLQSNHHRAQNMTLLERLIAHPGYERIKSIYNELFPLEVHFVSANWIEEQCKIEQQYPTCEKRAIDFMRSLCDCLEMEKTKFIRPDQIPNIEEIIQNFYKHMRFNTSAMYNKIRDVITFLNIFFDNTNEIDQMPIIVNARESLQINEMLNYSARRISEIKETHNQYNIELNQLKTLEHSEKIAVGHRFPNGEGTETNNQKPSGEEFAVRKRAIIDKIELTSHVLTHNLGTVIKDITKVQCIVIYKPLARWQRGQALAGNGETLPVNILDHIQEWFEKLAHLILFTRGMVGTILSEGQILQSVYKDYFAEITKMLEFLLISGFIVEHQPPQVLKTNAQ